MPRLRATWADDAENFPSRGSAHRARRATRPRSRTTSHGPWPVRLRARLCPCLLIQPFVILFKLSRRDWEERGSKFRFQGKHEHEHAGEMRARHGERRPQPRIRTADRLGEEKDDREAEKEPRKC